MSLKKLSSHSFLALVVCCTLAIAFFSSCNTFIGKAYENTTGRYNSYFLAKEKMKEVDVALKASIKDDYHRILSLHYPSDSNFGKSQSAALEEVFKYSSWSVRFHKRSKWADNCYILIGKVRHYQFNYKDGLETFKYVNATSTSLPERHEALIQMMKFFTDFGEYDNVKYVVDFMDKEPYSTKKNKRDYLIAKAAYYQHYADYKKAHALLDTALPLCNRKQDRARLAFINGQICEYLKEESGETKTTLDFDADLEAAQNYRKTLNANPKYELWFNARINLMRVSKHSALKDIDKARKYYQGMLADLKNSEFKDRIYYEFARFERKQKEYKTAEEYYKNSVKNANSNQRQKAYSYLALGEMYYEDQQRFEDAKLYYDSTIAILPKDHKGYGKIFRRQRVLKEFVENLNTVKREDSLQRLAKMDTAQLSTFLNEYIAKEEKRLNEEAKQLAKLAKKNARNAAANPFNDEFSMNNPNATNQPGLPPGATNGQQGGTFYFYNQLLATQGKLEFQQKWGRRKLEDYWRISNKETETEDRITNNPSDTSKTKNNLSTQVGVGEEQGAGEDELPPIKINKQDLYKTIPSTEEKLKESHAKVQGSLFKLGKIYNQHLGEPENSIKVLERLISEYPINENVPEAHYIIYLISKGKDSTKMEHHKSVLLDKFPHTIYAKMILNPNYLAESKILNKQIMARYKVAYEAYMGRHYKDADSLFVQIQMDYPNNDFDQQIELVRAIMKARSGKREDYRMELQTYVDKYKTGQYHDHAKQLIDKYDAQHAPKTAEPATSDSTVSPNPDTSAPGTEHNQPSRDEGGVPDEIRKLHEERMRDRGRGSLPPSPEEIQMQQRPPNSTPPQMTPPVNEQQGAQTQPSNPLPPQSGIGTSNLPTQPNVATPAPQGSGQAPVQTPANNPQVVPQPAPKTDQPTQLDERKGF